MVTGASTATAETLAKKKAPWKTDGGFYFYVGGGWMIPMGNVSEIGDVIEFPSTSASDIYKQNAFILSGFGLYSGKTFVEMGVDFGILRFTATGQELANTLVTDDRQVSAEIGCVGLAVGRVFLEGDRFAPFASVSGGLLWSSLTPDGGEDRENDLGFGLATKIGVDTFLRRNVLRAGIRFQLLALGTNVPYQTTFFVALSILF